MTRPRALTWRPESPWARFLHLHGLGAHAGWCAPLAERLAAAGVEVIAPNLFRSTGTELPSPAEFVAVATAALTESAESAHHAHHEDRAHREDHGVRSAYAHHRVRESHPTADLPLFLAGTSLGGCLAVELSARLPAEGVCLFAPALHATYLPPSVIGAMVARLCVGGGGAYGTPIHRGIPVVRDEDLLERLRHDPDAVPAFSARSHLRAQHLITLAWWRLVRSNTPPILCLQGDEDEVVSAATNRRLFGGRAGREYAVVRGGRHDLPWEPDTDAMTERLLAWMRERVSGSA